MGGWIFSNVREVFEYFPAKSFRRGQWKFVKSFKLSVRIDFVTTDFETFWSFKLFLLPNISSRTIENFTNLWTLKVCASFRIFPFQLKVESFRHDQFKILKFCEYFLEWRFVVAIWKIRFLPTNISLESVWTLPQPTSWFLNFGNTSSELKFRGNRFLQIAKL